MYNAIEVLPRSEATATADDEAPDDDNDDDDDAEDEEVSVSVFMELDLPQWNSTARRINHSHEETIANGGGDVAVPRSDMIADFLRKSSWSAFLRRFLMFSLINLSFPVFSRRFLVSRSSCFLAQCLHRPFFCCFLSFPPGSRPTPGPVSLSHVTPLRSRSASVGVSQTRSLVFVYFSSFLATFFLRTDDGVESSSSEIRSLPP